MKYPILLNIKELFPQAIEKDGAPANCLYRIAYAEKKHWQTDSFRIIKQQYSAKLVYLSLLEVDSKFPLQLTIDCTEPNLFLFYQVDGSTLFTVPNKNGNHFLRFEEHEYCLIYASEREYQIQLSKNKNLVFFVGISADWLLGQSEKHFVHFEYLLSNLRERAVTCINTRKMIITPKIQKEFLELIHCPILPGLEMDAAVYPPVARLVNLSHEAWANKEANKTKNIALLNSVREFIQSQIKKGHIPPLSEIADTFEVSNQYLARLHNERFGNSLQNFSIICKLEESRRLIEEEGLSPSRAGYAVGYNSLSHFSAQFKRYFKVSPSDLYKKS